MRPVALLLLALVGGLSASPAAPGAEVDPGAAFAAGAAAFEAGDFETAKTWFERAYAADPAPILVYNLARAHEEMGQAEAATRYFRAYLEAAPDATDRADVERRIRVMEAIVERGASSYRPWAWAAGGVALGAAVGATLFGIEAREAEERNGTAVGAELDASADEAEDAALAANALWAATAVFATASVLLLFADGDSGVAVIGQPGGAGVAWRLDW